MYIQFKPIIKKDFGSNLVTSLLRLLPGFKGDWLLYCWLLSFFPKKMRMVNFEVTVNRKKLIETYFDIADPPQFTMVRKNRYDLGTALVIWFLLKEGEVFIDVGANSGYLSCVAARKVGSSGQVISVEPNMTAFKRLLKHKFINIFTLNFAVSDFSGKCLKVKKPFYRQTTSSYCLEGEGTKSITLDYIYEKFNRPSVKLIKVDTEGMEFMVMKGAKRLLIEKSPYVILELEEEHSERYGYEIVDVVRFMRGIGYHRCYFINDDEASIKLLESFRDGQILFSKDELNPERFRL